MLNRREFLIGAAAVAAAARPRGLWAESAAQARQAKQSTLDRIAIMTLNFQSMLKLPDLPEGPNRTLELFAVPEMLADRYGVHKVEFQHYHIPSTEPSYLKELRAQIEKTRSRMTQINLEFAARVPANDVPDDRRQHAYAGEHTVGPGDGNQVPRARPGYKGLYTIEASNGHEGTQPIYELVVATL
jgi:hypothetical protein